MICIISSAKTFNEEVQDDVGGTPTIPFALGKTEVILRKLQKLTPREIGELMHISDRLAHGNASRYKEWDKAEKVLALDGYNGDVFRAFKMEELSPDNWKNANKYLAIFSGLYGILRPTDGVKPYRLEMAIKMEDLLGESLYDFWRDDVTEQLNEMVAEAGASYILNVASKEYWSVLDMDKLSVPMINVDFKNQTEKGLKIIAIHAKRARGRMARFVLDNEIDSLGELKKFTGNGYAFRGDLSTAENLVFVA